MNPRLLVPFYLGLGAPCTRKRYPDCRVRAAAGCDPEFVRTLLLIHRGESTVGQVRRINHRCAEVVLPEGRRFFVKEFPWHHRFHDLERGLRLSRVDRAWRAAHLLPRFGINTPRAVGTAVARDERGRPIEYLATEWLDGARPFPEVVGASKTKEERLTLLCEFAHHLRQWHEHGVYLRDLVKNVLVVGARPAVPASSRDQSISGRYWLTDLDGLHPVKSVSRARVLHHMRQLAHHVGPLTAAEADAVCASYADRRDEGMAAVLATSGSRPPQG